MSRIRLSRGTTTGRAPVPVPCGGTAWQDAAMPLRQRTVCLLALSAVPDDPRVRRQGDAFHARGWKVTGVGLPGARSAPPAWELRDGGADAGERAVPDLERGGSRLLERARLA